MNHITIPSNIERICRICYILSYCTILTFYLPIIAVLLVTYNKLLRPHLVGSIFLCKGTAVRERQVPLFLPAPLMDLVDLTTTFRNFRQAEIGYFINSSAIYLSYPSVSSVFELHVKFRSRQESR